MSDKVEQQLITDEAPKFLPDRPRRLLMIGYNTLDEAYAKGIVLEDVPETFDLALNFGRYFEMSYLFIPFGRKDVNHRLTDTIYYHELTFAHRRSWLRMLWALAHLYRSARELRRLAQEIKPDVIQVCGPHLPNIIFMLSRLRGKYPVTCFLEAFWEDILLAQTSLPWGIKKILPWYYRLTYRYYPVFFGTPSLDMDFYVRRGMVPDRIADWLQPVDIRLIDAARHLAEQPGIENLPRPRIITVGRLHEEKCCLDAVEVLKRVRDVGIDASLVLVGDGPQRDAVEAIVDGYGLHGKVEITGQISIVQGLTAVWNSDIYFAPMQGSALLEALAMGRAVVAYDHETHRALICDGVTGLLTPHRDVDAAARAVVTLLRDTDYAQRLGENARRHCESKLESVRMSRRVNDGAYRAHRNRYAR
jgi:glycosyltransferase involved in cell wall biosynthesis